MRIVNYRYARPILNQRSKWERKDLAIISGMMRLWPGPIRNASRGCSEDRCSKDGLPRPHADSVPIKSPIPHCSLRNVDNGDFSRYDARPRKEPLMRIAVPSDSTDGLDAAISEHFGHCAAFTIIAVENGAIGEVSIVENVAHEHGGCMTPVHLLKEHGVEVLVAGGMGGRPLSGFEQVGIDVRFKGDADTVREAVELFLAGGCPSFEEAQTCSGHEGGCGHDHHHHHHEPETFPIEGTADVREGRMITLDYELKDGSGDLLDSSATSGPLRFIYGVGQTLPAIEQAVAGLEPGANVTKAVQAKDAFGDRDEARIVEVPREQLPPSVAVGMVVTAQDAQGREFPLAVTHLDERIARLDGNHPLAGKDLVFVLTVKNVEGVKTA